MRYFGIRYLGWISWQNSLKPVPSTILIGLMSLHMNEGSFFVHASCLAADKELVVGGEKYEPRCACLFGCTFSRCALMLLWWNGKLTVAYTACIQLHLEAPHFCCILTKIWSISKRGFLGCLESKPLSLSLLPSWALNFLSVRPLAKQPLMCFFPQLNYLFSKSTPRFLKIF